MTETFEQMRERMDREARLEHEAKQRHEAAMEHLRRVNARHPIEGTGDPAAEAARVKFVLG